VRLIQRRWPTSFGHFEQHSDGPSSGFCWDNTYPELLRAAFYPLAAHDQPRKRVIFRGPPRTGLPHRPGTSFVQSTAVPGTTHTPNVERVAQGRIWYDFHVTYSDRY
jgi:hypothetical protein